jgi:hypothetical protein
VQVNRKITRATRGILLEYKDLILKIKYTRAPIYTAGDLAYFTALASIVTNGFTREISPQERQEIFNGEIPVDNGTEKYRIINSLRRSWQSSREHRHRNYNVEALNEEEDQNSPVAPRESPNPQEDESFIANPIYLAMKKDAFIWKKP